jgi:ribose transport system ATP-binding protein
LIENTNTPFIELCNANIAFGNLKAINDINISILAGEVVAIVGEHGAGKSTLAAAINGSVQLSSGKIKINGIPHLSLTIKQALSYGIEMVHQQNLLFYESTVAENILITSTRAQSSIFVNRKKIIQQTTGFLNRLGIDIDPNSRLKDLTSSDRVLVDILHHVYPNPRLLILDEALEKLSPSNYSKIIGIIKELSQAGSSIIIITFSSR